MPHNTSNNPEVLAFGSSPSGLDPFPFFAQQQQPGKKFTAPDVMMKDDTFTPSSPSFAGSTKKIRRSSQATKYPTNQSIVVTSRKRKTVRSSLPQHFEHSVSINEMDDAIALPKEQILVVETQPPIEVRTRTPSEKRHFSCSVRLLAGHKDLHIERITARLWYKLPSGQASVSQSILGGTKTVAVHSDGVALFNMLSMSEASTKHGENEFCLEFIPIAKSGKKLLPYATFSRGFYAYSHMKVLTRRKNIKLRALSTNHGGVNGGREMHVVGAPFVKGPFLSVLFRTPHGDVAATGVNLYSDSVLFFQSPAYPDEDVIANMSAGMEIKADIVVTNDGRNMSNPITFTFLAEGSYRAE